MQVLIQPRNHVQEFLETWREVLIRILEDRRMNSRIAINAEEGILPLDSHAQARISRQQAAGNEIKTAPEK